MSRQLRLLLAVLLSGCGLASTASAADIGTKINRFSLPDIHGRDRSLDELADKSVLVVAFMGTECPMARLYAPRLQELSEKFAAQGVAFVAIDANPQDSLTDMFNFVQQSGLKFPMLKDRDQSIADEFGVVRNPQVFVLDRERAIRYMGRIDDQYGIGSSSGYSKGVAKHNDLVDALTDVLAGKPVTTPKTEALGCLVTRTPKTAAKGDVTYSKNIATLLENNCVSCHRPGQIGPFALQDYDQAAGWGAMMKEVVSDGRMPPWSANPEFGHFSNDRRLSAEDKKMLFDWIDNGCPQGDLADLPKPRVWTDGWSMPVPDQVVYFEKPFKVPAEGVLPYQNIVVDPKWTEDKWIQAIEVQPGNRQVVHHIIASAVAPPRSAPVADDGATDAAAQALAASAARAGAEGAGLSNYVPGGRATIYPEGVATLVKAGSKIRFQMHYTPNGIAQEDVSYIGFKFADPKTVKKKIRGGVAGNQMFSIPPNNDNFKIVAETTMRSDQLMYWMMPHMHVRGKSMRYEAQYPDGSREILLDVPKYDFNWQITYEMAEPKLLPTGTKVLCTAYYDNSENNPANPDPNATVRFGPQTWHEMMFGWFWTLPVADDYSPASPAPSKSDEHASR